jgi:ABC-type polysaccharide/polyol phosphate export permease
MTATDPPENPRRPLSQRQRIKNVNPTMRKSALVAFNDRELLLNFIKRDLGARYRRSALGWSWSLISPAIVALIYTFVFTVLFPVRPAPGDPSGMKLFAFHLLAALLPWNLVQGGVNASIGALLGGGGMMQKVRFAREHLIIGAVYALVVSLCLELLVLALLELAFGYFVFHMLPIILFLILLLSLFTIGVSFFFAAMNIRYRDVQHITGVFFLVWLYLSPIVYSVALIPKSYMVFGRRVPLQKIFLLNPMARFSQAFRNCFFDIRTPGLNTMLALVVASVGVFLAGYRFFIRRAPWFVEEL